MSLHKDYESWTVAALRRYSVDNGYGVTHLSERTKADIIKILREEDVKSEKRLKPEPVGECDACGRPKTNTGPRERTCGRDECLKVIYGD